jgi:hypothetical protein
MGLSDRLQWLLLSPTRRSVVSTLRYRAPAGNVYTSAPR